MSEDLKTIDILTGLKQLIGSPEKFTKGQLTDGQGAYCLVGGIRKITTGEPAGRLEFGYDNLSRLIAKIARAMRISPNIKSNFFTRDDALWQALVDFNNAADTTFEKVSARLDRAIKRVQSHYGHRQLEED